MKVSNFQSSIVHTSWIKVPTHPNLCGVDLVYIAVIPYKRYIALACEAQEREGPTTLLLLYLVIMCSLFEVLA